MQEQELERLVEVITRIVRDRLFPGGPPAQQSPTASLVAGLSSQVCSLSETQQDCQSCGAKVDALLSAGAHRIGAQPFGTDAPVAASLSGDVARAIDHTLLKPEATPEEVRRLCDEARKYSFASVCVNPGYVPLACSVLGGTVVKVVAVVGFPLGATSPASKAYEACEAVAAGADEIDMVINIGALKALDYRVVFDDIRMVVESARPAPVKVILETSKLDDEDKIAACALAKVAGAAFVKTSTGFGGGGATLEDVALMRRVVGPSLGVKASGGVRTREQAEAMLAAGATRIGASASVAIVTGERGSKKGY